MSRVSGHVIRDGRLVLKRSCVPTGVNLINQLQAVPDFSKQLVILYKQFFRLRRLVGNASAVYYELQYTNLLRRVFRNRDFNFKRKVFIPESSPILQQDMLHRCAKTLAFVFNSTIDPNSGHQRSLLFYSNTNLRNDTTLERKVIETILQIDHKSPSRIKHNHRYTWKTNISPSDHIALGLDQYETILMRMNETMGMCL